MISIIIPALNEEEHIGELLSFLNRICLPETEVLVVDGGSSDSTVQVVKSFGVKVLTCPEKGRAKQMNYGAKNARGELLYFLHADTFPPPTFQQDIQQKTAEGFDCGCFLLSFNISHPALNFYSWFTRFDLKYFRFGDQSLFVKKALFQEIGRFSESLAVMEDQEIIERLKSRAQFSLIQKKVITSARKYQRFGVFRLQWIFTIIVLLYYMGVSQKVLVDFYKKACAGNQY